jgi:NAD(P)-dependent dehydrogenase (short-subunit alcohol dehydrogenase family)
MTIADKTVLVTGPAAIEHHLAVNLFGTLAMTQAFLPALSPLAQAVDAAL